MLEVSGPSLRKSGWVALGTNGPGRCLNLLTGSQYRQGADKQWAELPLDFSSGRLIKPVTRSGSPSLKNSKPKYWDAKVCSKLRIYLQCSQARRQEKASHIHLPSARDMEYWYRITNKETGDWRTRECGERWLGKGDWEKVQKSSFCISVTKLQASAYSEGHLCLPSWGVCG